MKPITELVEALEAENAELKKVVARQSDREILRHALITIVNTTQMRCPGMDMVDVCNDNFRMHGLSLRARRGPGNKGIKIEDAGYE